MAFSLKKSESILLQKNNRACRQVCDRHSLKYQTYHFLYTLAMPLNLYSTSGCFSSKPEAGNLLLPYKYFNTEMPSAYEKCCAVVKDTIKVCAWILPCWWQTVVTVSFCCTLLIPQKNLETEFFECLRDKWVPSSYSLSYSRNPFGGRQCNNPSGRTTWGIQEKSETRGRVVEVGNWTKGVNLHLEPDPGCIENSTGNNLFVLGMMYWSVLKEGRWSLDARR